MVKILILDRLTLFLFLFLFLGVRFQVSVFRICYCLYLPWSAWGGKPDTRNRVRGTKTV